MHGIIDLRSDTITGVDAAPYFRIQNPWTQSQRFDPASEYIRKWVPELRDVPLAAGLRLARDYPPPMLDHAAERERTLRMFKDHRPTRSIG